MSLDNTKYLIKIKFIMDKGAIILKNLKKDSDD